MVTKYTEHISKTFLKNLPAAPGVYLMYNAKDEIIYVGKAKNLKNRVNSYFVSKLPEAKTLSLVKHIAKIAVTVTPTEQDALLLECNLIKEHHPKYNILLRDDKSYPYILVTTDEDYPRIDFYRGKKIPRTGRYFGPYPSVATVRETLNLLQKIFKIRSCRDAFFRNRTRPCLQYQIKRCSAPCVKFIAPEPYQVSVNNAIQFLQGKSQDLITSLERQMEALSSKLEFEQAANCRDQIVNLRRVQQQQHITAGSDNIDIIGIAIQQHIACVQLLNVRHGQVVGSHSYFPSVPHDFCEKAEIIAAFIPQYYSMAIHQATIPSIILITQAIPEPLPLEHLLTSLRGKKCIIKFSVKGIRAKWQALADHNATVALNSHLSARTSLYDRFAALQQVLHLDSLPQRLECFDVSHTGGEATVASCVVFDNNGPLKSAYRRFNIKDITPGDDYAAMQQALTRHYLPLKNDESKLPDILFVDGGKGQVNTARTVLEELQISSLLLIGVAKGPGRKPGLETLIIAHDNKEITLPDDSPALHLIQHIRDEAHRFAILGHRHKRDKQRITSTLENIEGIGAKRRQALYHRFGGLQEIKLATIDELVKVPGISRELAKKIYDEFHE